MKIRKDMEKNLKRLLQEKVEDKKREPILTGLIKALNEVWFYLDSQSVDKQSMPYTDLDKMFGYLDKEDIKRILLDAITDKNKRWLSRMEEKDSIKALSEGDTK